MKIVMTAAEIALLESFMRQSRSYFEFGMGGSTCLAARTVQSRISAIDSDTQWVENVREEIGTSDKEIILERIDIGRTGDWGTPIGRESQDKFPAYSKAVLEQPTDVDLCLVDGRFRVSCFLTALHHLRPDAVLAIHDYVRPEYFEIETFARPIAGADNLRMFLRRPDVDMQALQRRAEETRLDPR